jgi:hypothetical protein
VCFAPAARGNSSIVTSDPVTIYLHDHLAGSTVGSELAKRTLKENAGTQYESVLRELVTEIAEDRQSLLDTMARLAVRPSRIKVALGWATEKVGRLKLNGSLRDYSPLSRLLEFEGLILGVEGKRALWVSLAQLRDPRLAALDFDALASRASHQQERLEQYRSIAAREALAR